MENSYPEFNTTCKLVKTKFETIRFLLDYSKSMHIIDANGISFETSMN